jgi:Tfp pilus assembly protein PilX
MRLTPPTRQRGVILMIALIMLVAMTLAGIALVRSMDTSNIIAGNLAFQQSAASGGDKGIETAVTTLQNTVAADILANPVPSTGTPAWAWADSAGYAASLAAPADITPGTNWDVYWRGTLATTANLVVSLNGGAADTFGNRISYVVQRMCAATGDPSDTTKGCSRPTVAQPPCNSEPCIPVTSNQVNYRITSRIVGPRNTISYVQAIIGL